MKWMPPNHYLSLWRCGGTKWFTYFSLFFPLFFFIFRTKVRCCGCIYEIWKIHQTSYDEIHFPISQLFFYSLSSIVDFHGGGSAFVYTIFTHVYILCVFWRHLSYISQSTHRKRMIETKGKCFIFLLFSFCIFFLASFFAVHISFIQLFFDDFKLILNFDYEKIFLQKMCVRVCVTRRRKKKPKKKTKIK